MGLGVPSECRVHIGQGDAGVAPIVGCVCTFLGLIGGGVADPTAVGSRLMATYFLHNRLFLIKARFQFIPPFVFFPSLRIYESRFEMIFDVFKAAINV